MRPLIGVTSAPANNQYGQPITVLTQAYSRALIEAGAVPVLVPSFLDAPARQELFPRLDGLLFSGGGDIDPLRYHGDSIGRLIDLDAARDELELDLLRMAVEARKPFLGICRGCQVLNVGLGGTLYPDLLTEPGGALNHDLPGSERAVLVHDVSILQGTELAGILGGSVIGVNSHHHQGLRAIASGLRVAAIAPDGLVEAVEIPDHPFGLAVQWHPEWLTHQPWTRNLFGRLTDAAAGLQ
jgi:putative glutamine amidotransferase